MSLKEYAKTLTVLVTAHAEASYIVPTLRSLEEACRDAEAQGLDLEISIVLDSTDDFTRAIVEEFKIATQIRTNTHTTNFGCPAQARNFGVNRIRSKYTAIHDADDLMSRNWLTEAIKKIEQYDDEDLIAHPEWNVTFDNSHTIMRHPCMLEEDIDFGNILYENFWTALIVCKTTTLLRVPYRSNKESKIFGYEDWDWNLKALVSGSKHIAIQDTYHFIRRKTNGVSAREFGQQRTVREAKFFLTKKYFLSGSQPKKKEQLNQIYSFDEHAYEIAYPDVKAGVESGVFINCLEHYIKYGNKEGRIKFPRNFLSTAYNLSNFDYTIFPDQSFLRSYSEYFPVKKNRQSRDSKFFFSKLYFLTLTKSKNFCFDYIVVCPWIKKGGADLAAIHHLNGIAKNNKKTLLVLTEESTIEWSERIPAGVAILELGSILRNNTQSAKMHLLMKTINITKAKVLHVINSEVGWDLIEQRSAALDCKIYVSLYCYDYTKTGKPVGYATRLMKCSKYIDGVISDNSNFLVHLNSQYGIPFRKMVAAPHPIYDFTEIKKIALHDPHSSNILWASRLDHQKRPDVLYSIAKACPDFIFFVYGSSLLEESDKAKDLFALPNIRTCGPFSNIKDLAKQKYLCFLYTSQWDGLPNILLEIGSTGLPIISPPVGGISDFLEDGRGMLCEQVDAIDDYIKHIRALREDKSLGTAVAKSLLAYIAKNHNLHEFMDKLSFYYNS